MAQHLIFTRKALLAKIVGVTKDQQIRGITGSIEPFHKLEELTFGSRIGVPEMVNHKENWLHARAASLYLHEICASNGNIKPFRDQE